MKSLFTFSAVLLIGAGSVLAGAQNPSPSGQIDQILSKWWSEAGVQGNSPATDEVFLRRIYLDVAGRIPTQAEAQKFLASQDQDKRARLIDELLNGEAYVNHYFNYWADVLRINTGQGGGQSITPYYVEYVRNALRDNKPYNEFVYELLTAQGQAVDNGAIGYTYRDMGMPLDHMANTVRIFLGTRLECAQCHNHPFDKWTQMDFFNMAAFSYGMGTANVNYGGNDLRKKIREMAGDDRKRQNELNQALREIQRPIRNNREVAYNEKKLPELPHDYQYDDAKPKQKVEPFTMFGDNPEIASESGRIHAYGEWMTSPENPRFTTVIANRLWKQAFGMGLIEPVDELMDDTKPANAELMNFLEDYMIETGYDMKAYLSAIFNSKAYQSEASKTEVALGETYHFTGPVLRRMTAEQAWDSMVTLINPNPELPDWKRQQQTEMSVLSQKHMQEALMSIPEEKLVAYTKEIADLQAELAEETRQLTRKIEQLRKQGKNDEAQKLSREARNMRNKIRSTVEEMVYEPALKKTEVTYASFQLPDGATMELNPSMTDANGRPNNDFRKIQAEAEAAMIEREMDELGLTDENERKQFSNLRRNAGRYLRAAHIGSPAPNGHFLREFGQSDRETIENASDEASVPQALNLMNGRDFQQIAGSSSILTWNLNKAETLEEKVDLIFLNMLSRKPTNDEKEFILAAAEVREDKVVEDTIFALLNSQEFLFVQ